MRDVAVGLAGVGYWGSKLARNLHEAVGSRLAAICDPDPGRLAAAGERHPQALRFRTYEDLISCEEVEAIVIATSAFQHVEQARVAIEAGKHVLVEKPLALNVPDCSDLIERAEASQLTLMVGHTFIYSEPVRYLRRLIETGELGRVLYAYAHRLNLGVIREDLNALWNFGPHDISILLYVLGNMPERVSAQQYSLLNRQIEDVVFMVLEFPDGIVAHVHESWLDPRKIRQLTIVGDKKMAVYDDTDVETPIRIYDKGVAVPNIEFAPSGESGYGEFKLETRSGDMLAPRVLAPEPLRLEVEHFVDCVANDLRSDTDGYHGRSVVGILEAAELSARTGNPVALDSIVATISR